MTTTIATNSLKQVEDYIIKLLNADIADEVFPEEIGVVSPYALQVKSNCMTKN